MVSAHFGLFWPSYAKFILNLGGRANFAQGGNKGLRRAQCESQDLLASVRDVLEIAPQRGDEMKKVIKQTPPKMAETIWINPLFQWFQPISGCFGQVMPNLY